MDEGFRLLVAPDKQSVKWIHPSMTGYYPNWIDATDFDDDEFLELIHP